MMVFLRLSVNQVISTHKKIIKNNSENRIVWYTYCTYIGRRWNQKDEI